MLSIRYIFISPLPKNRLIWPRKKITGALKKYCFLKIWNTFILLKRTINKNKNKNLKYFKNFVKPQKGQIGFDLVKGKTILFWVSLYFQLKKKTKEHILCGAGLKIFCLLSAPLQGKSRNFLSPCAKLKSNIKMWNFWNWGPKTISHNLPSAQFFLKKYLHPIGGVWGGGV